jgi:hypothetical protein
MKATTPMVVAVASAAMLATTFELQAGDDEGLNIQVKVLKACEACALQPAAPCNSTVFHKDQAAVWVPNRNIRIYAVSIPEQSEVTLYTDIEVSTAPEMYLPDGHIFRVKYAGPAIQREPPCDVSFAGSNITDTNINFAPNWINIPAGTPVYVHMDVINWTPYTINPMTQDVYLYYSYAAGHGELTGGR